MSILFFLVACGPGIEKVTEETWPDGSSKVIRHYTMTEGKRTLAREISFYEDGIKRLEGEFKKGQRDGEWKYWYKDGTLWSEGYFKEGKRSGPGTTYHPNGNKYIEGTYENGERVGKWTFWDENGSLIKEIDYNAR